MSNNKKQYQSLNKKEEQEFAWIQMQKVDKQGKPKENRKKKETFTNERTSNPINDDDLDPNQPSRTKQNNSNQYSSTHRNDNPSTQTKIPTNKIDQSRTYQQQPAHSMQRTHENWPPQLQTPSMQVACNYCTAEQTVPGYTRGFVCFCCQNVNECFPLYGVFDCWYCRQKVSYPFGVSSFIRCTRCNNVNKVSSEPDQILQKQRAEQQALKKKQKKEEEAKEEEIIVDEEGIQTMEKQQKKQSKKKSQKQQRFYQSREDDNQL